MNAMFINGNPMKAISSLLLVASLIFPVPAMLATFEDGWDLMYQGDFDKAYKIFFELSESGDPYGTFGLGVMYQFGNGVEKDEKKAMEYYVEAANEDVVEAMHNIGYLYQHGKGVDVDLKEAIKWYGKAANLGYGVSQNDLAYLYEHGIGTPIDLDKAFDLYKKAAEQQIPNSVVIVGFMAKDTLGRRLVEGRREVRVLGLNRDVYAEIHVLDGLSARADQDDLVQFARATAKVGRMRRIAMVHGESAARLALKERLREIGDMEIISAEKGQRIEL